MQKNSIEMLHQIGDLLAQKASLLSLTRGFRDPPSKIIQEVTR